MPGGKPFDTTAPSGGDILVFNATTGKWESGTNINVAANSLTSISLGEATTARGTSQEAALLLYGEDGASAITTATIRNTGTQLSFTTDNSAGIQFTASNNLVQVLSGAALQVYDAGNTDYIELKESGTLATIECNNNSLEVELATGKSFTVREGGLAKFHVDHTNDLVQVRDGYEFRVQDSTDVDYVTILHDGTDGIIKTNAGSLNFETQNGVFEFADDSAADAILRVFADGGTTIYVDLRPVSSTYQRLLTTGSKHFNIGPDIPGSVTTSIGWQSTIDHTFQFNSVTANDITASICYANEGTDNYRMGMVADSQNNDVGLSAAYSSNEPEFHIYRAGVLMMKFDTAEDPFFPGHGTTASAANAEPSGCAVQGHSPQRRHRRGPHWPHRGGCRSSTRARGAD
jgi:hypothetical protein